MRITELLDKKSISLTAAPKTKSETLDMAVDLMAAGGKIKDKEAYKKLVTGLTHIHVQIKTELITKHLMMSR